MLIAASLMLPLASISLQPASTEWPIFWEIRAYIVNYTGVTTMLIMSMTVILSVKHWPFEKWLAGLDKQYKLHKYLGIAAVLCGFVHWLGFLSDDLAMDLGYIETKQETYPFWKSITQLGDPAQFIGEWGFYISVVVAAIALIKYFPHHFFQITHKIIPYLYLLLVLHMLIFFEASLWLTASGLVLAAIVLLASIASFINIFGLNGINNCTEAKIVAINSFNNGLEVTLQAAENIQHYRPGQFVFIAFDQKESPHPFSIASKVSQTNELRFLIKANGDYTSTLADTLKLNQTVKLEGPYGCFDFNDKAAHQIWIAGGIGITPFISALESQPTYKKIDIFYTYKQADKGLLKKLQALANDRNITLRLYETSNNERLSSKDILKRIDRIDDCSVWFCGPTSLGEQCKSLFQQEKLPEKSFHQELFSFR